MKRQTLLATTAHAVAYAGEPGQVTPGFVADPSSVAKGVGTQGTVVDRNDPYMKRSADNAAMLAYWDQTDNIVDGIAAMTAAADKYLPRFVDEDSAAYQFRLNNATMTNVYRDIVESLANKPFEKEVKPGDDAPEPIVEFCEDVDGSSNNITTFAASVFFNGINSAIDWIFVDFDKADPNIVTVADAKASGQRPYWSRVLGRNVLDARIKVIAGKETLTYMRIEEPGTPTRIRVFEREPVSGVVTFEVREKRATQIDSPLGRTNFHPVEGEGGTVTIGVIPLVPFYTGRRDGRTFRFFPAMRDAADMQIKLYRNETALEHVKVLAGYPMLAGNGISPVRDEAGAIMKLAVGPGRVLYGPRDGNGNAGSWAYVQPDASLLTFLAANITETISQLREIGRQPLTAQSGNITTITAAISAGKAKSAVGQWGLALKDALENAMVLTCMWMGIDYDPEIQVYTDFDEFTEGKDVEALSAARTAGDLSQQTYWFELSRRGILSDEFDADEERERLLSEVPGDGMDMTEDQEPPEIPPAQDA